MVRSGQLQRTEYEWGRRTGKRSLAARRTPARASGTRRGRATGDATDYVCALHHGEVYNSVFSKAAPGGTRDRCQAICIHALLHMTDNPRFCANHLQSRLEY